jgi:hypothetical protein
MAPPYPRSGFVVFVDATAWLESSTARFLIVSDPELKMPPPLPPATTEVPRALFPPTSAPSSVAVDPSAA